MRFGPVPLDLAMGAVLAHSIPLASGRLRKGLVLGPDHLAALAAAGIDRITVARLAGTDATEDEAAQTLARALAGPGLDLHPVGTGRVNLLASGPGIARIDAPRVHAVNATDPAITLATVPEWTRLDTGGMLATIKIITYGASRARLGAACKSGSGSLSLALPVLFRATLIETFVGGTEPGPKGHAVTAERLARLDVTLAPPRHAAHDETSLAHALRATPDDVDLILILTGSATSDSDDVCPGAIRRAGGHVERFGMPVDPGNLLVLGALNGRPVIGLPGCARSPALNGADWVLERLICGVPVTGADIAGMGVGGLLKEIPQRPRPRRQTG